MAICGKCGAQVADHMGNCWQCSAPLNPYQFQGTGARPYAQTHGTGDATGGLIPYKNVPALVGYYIGIVALCPCVPIFSIAAIVLGIMGLNKVAREPVVKGTVHAWIAIVLGGVSLLYNTLFTIVFSIGMSGGFK
jgi:Domain of unknown function (DUF4190)